MLTHLKARSDFGTTLFTKALIFALLFLQGIFIARWLGAETKGAHAKLQASCQLLVIFFEIGISHAITYFVASGKLTIQKALGFSIIYGGFILSLFGLIGLGFSLTSFLDFLLPLNLHGATLVLYLILSAIAELLRIQIVAFLTSQTLFADLNRWERNIAILRVILFGSFFLGLNVAASEIRLDLVLIADLSVNILGLLTYLWIYSIRIGKYPSFDFEGKKLFSNVTQYASLIYFSNLINYLFIRIDYWIVEYFLGSKELGFYSVSVGICLGITFIPLTMATVLFPHLSQEPDESKEELFSSYSRLNFTGMLILSILIYFLAPTFIPALFGESYEPSVHSLQFLIWGYLIAAFRYLFGVYLKVTDALRLRVESDIVGVIACFALSMLATPLFGISGTVAAFSGANLIALVYVMYRGRHQLGHWHQYFILRRADLRYFFNIDL